jgi:hypothetical protein
MLIVNTEYIAHGGFAWVSKFLLCCFDAGVGGFGLWALGFVARYEVC